MYVQSNGYLRQIDIDFNHVAYSQTDVKNMKLNWNPIEF